MHKWTDGIVRYPGVSLLIVLALTALVSLKIPATRFDPSIQSFIMEDDADYAFYNRYKSTFGQDDMLVVAFEADDVFDADTLRLVKQLTERLEKVDNIFDVKSLTNVEFMKGTGDSFEAVKLVEKIPLAADVERARREKAHSSPLFRDDVVSEDTRETAILVTLRAVPDKDYLYEKEIRDIERIVKETSAEAGKPIHLIGERYLDLKFLGYIHRDLKVFIPLTFGILAMLLLFLFRNVRYTVVSLVAISACLMWAGGLIPLLGMELNSINAGLSSLVMCIAVTQVVHIIHRYRTLRCEIPGDAEAVEATLREVMMPCFLTTFTTVLGFGSLATSRIHPIKGFGVLAALAILASFVICIVMVPACLRLWPGRGPALDRERDFGLQGLLTKLISAIVRRPWRWAAVSVVAVVIAGWGITRVHVQVDRIKYLKKSGDVYQAVDFVEKNLVGTSQLDVWIETGQEGVVKEPWLLRKIEALNEFLRAQPEIGERGKVMSVNEFLKEMNLAFFEDAPGQYVLPDTREKVAQYLLMYSMSGRKNEMDKYMDYPCSRTRISVRTSEHNSARLDVLIRRVNAYLAKEFPPPLKASVASTVIVYNNVFHYLVKGLVISFGTAVAIIGLAVCLGFRSLYAGLVSMIPNVIPVVMCLGLMGWIGIWLETATAMTFSIALGIAVDDTIHLLSRTRVQWERTGGDHTEALMRAIPDIGAALVETTVVMVGGFLVLIFASLKMNIIFGLLCAFIMVMALLCDLVITPLCIILLKPFRFFRLPGAPADRREKEQGSC